MTASATEVTGARPVAVAGTAPITADHHGVSFHDILSALNPLQYLPVVGTIYRAVTGDVIPEPLRRLGSLLVSGLLGGPIGVVMSLVTTAAEKITGLDPEKIIAAHFGAATTSGIAAAPPVPTIGPTSAVAPTPSAPTLSAPVSVPSAPTPSRSVPSASAQYAMTAAQLTAYGVRVDASGTLRLGDIRGADVLNVIELGRHAKATAAYAANQ